MITKWIKYLKECAVFYQTQLRWATGAVSRRGHQAISVSALFWGLCKPNVMKIGQSHRRICSLICTMCFQ